MQLPKQGAAIQRGVSYGALRSAGVRPALFGGIACRLCKAACNRLPIGSGLCKRACDRTVCR